MKGALTYKDLDRLKRKAAVLDQVREYLRERTVQGRDIEMLGLRDAVEAAYEEPACKAG